MNTPKSVDCLIVGGGVIGLCLARSLAKAGFSVRLFDAGSDRPPASWAGAGVLAPLYPWLYPQLVRSLAQESQQLYPSLIAELTEATGIDPEYRQSGLLIADPPEERLLAHRGSKYSGVELPKALDPEQAIWLPQVCQVRNPRLLKALQQDLRQRAVQMHFDEPVTKLLERNNSAQPRVVGVATAKANYSAEHSFITAGTWSSTGFTAIAQHHQVEPVRGQMLLYQLAKPCELPVILEAGNYLVPRADGSLLVGSTVERVGYTAETTAAGIAELRAFASRLLPELAGQAPNRAWAGLRPAIANHSEPYIGRVNGREHLWLSTGHYRTGLTTAPASAERLLTLFNPY